MAAAQPLTLVAAIERIKRKTVESAQKALVSAAVRKEQQVHKRALERSGVAPTVVRYADGRLVEQVTQARSAVILEFGYTREIVKTALLEWIKQSPVGPHSFQQGYRGKILVFVNGNKVNTLESIGHNDEVMLIATADYSRRLEVGRTKSDKVFSIKGHGLAERIAKQYLIRRFQRVADISFGYMDLNSAWTLKGKLVNTLYQDAGGKTRKRAGGFGRSEGEAVRYPTIFVKRKRR